VVVVQQRLIINRSAIKEPFYDRLTPVYTCAVIFGGAAYLCNELYLLNSWNLFPTNQTWQAATGYFICMAIAVFSVLIFSAGVALRDALMRMSAMVLLAITA